MTKTIRYERITILPSCDLPRRSVLLRITNEAGRFITGIEVNAAGDEVVAHGYDVRQHIIEKTAIMKRVVMKMNNKYGWLERAPEPKGATT